MRQSSAIVSSCLAIFFLLTPGLLPVRSTAVALQGATVAVYNGRGAWAESVVSFERFLDWKGVSWEEVTARDINNNDLRPLYQVLFMPGGFADQFEKAIKSSGLQNIMDFVASGGGYIGACAGAMFAADHTVAEGEVYEGALGLFEGHVEVSNDAIAPIDVYTMAFLQINKSNRINAYGPSTGYQLYYGGPVFYPHPDQPVRILATYTVNGAPAAINFRYGSGRVVLIATHPEIEEDSDRDGSTFRHELNDYGSDWPFLWTIVDWLLGQPISRPPESGDTVPPFIFSVTASPVLSSAGAALDISARVADNDAVKTVVLTVQGRDYEMVPRDSSSVLWEQALTVESFIARQGQGTGRAGAPYLEKSVDSTGFRDLEITYFRPVKGLGGFQLEWYDGAGWTYLERPGAWSSDGSDYRSRVLPLPNVAGSNPGFKVRLTVGGTEILRTAAPGLIRVTGKSAEWSYSLDTTGLASGTYTYAVSAVDHVGNTAAPVTGRFTIP